VLKVEIARRRMGCSTQPAVVGSGYMPSSTKCTRAYRRRPTMSEPRPEQKAVDLQELDRFFAEHYPLRR
jgi:hypothetical protein